MWNNQNGNTGNGIGWLIGFVVFLIVGAVLVGVGASNSFQWLNPKIGDAIAEQKHEEARAKRIENNEREQTVTFDAQQREKRAAQDLVLSRRWNEQLQDAFTTAITTVSSASSWALLIAVAGVLLKWLGVSQWVAVRTSPTRTMSVAAQQPQPSVAPANRKPKTLLVWTPEPEHVSPIETKRNGA